jgi:hypothetical protein
MMSYFRPVAILMAFLLMAMPVMAQVGFSDCEQGKIEGKVDGKAKSSPAWILAGLGFGCIGVGAAYLIKPSMPADRLVGKSPEYAMCYESAFKSASGAKQAGYAAIGWVIWILIFVTLILPNEDD